MSETQLTTATDKQIELLRSTFCKDANTQEFGMFLELCKATGLNPFLKEVWFIKMGGRPIIMTSRDGYMKIANSNPAFDGMESGTIDDNEGKPIKGYCKVYRKDRKFPIYCEAKFNEYYNTKNPIWNQYPSAMIQKVAEVMALKRSFSISGLVTKEEMEANIDNEIEKQPEPKGMNIIKETEIMFNKTEKLKGDYQKAAQLIIETNEEKKLKDILALIDNRTWEENQESDLKTMVNQKLEYMKGKNEATI